MNLKGLIAAGLLALAPFSVESQAPFSRGYRYLKNKKKEITYTVKEIPHLARTKNRVQACGLAAGDFDGDGVTDIVVGDSNGVNIYVGRSDMPEEFRFWKKISTNENRDTHKKYASGLAVGNTFTQINKQAYFYRLTKTYSEKKTHLYVGDRSKIEQYTVSSKGTILSRRKLSMLEDRVLVKPINSAGALRGLASSDINGDSIQDLLVGDSEGVHIFLNGTSGRPTDYGGKLLDNSGPIENETRWGMASGLAAGDLDGDGIDEYIVGDATDVMRILKYQNGKFERVGSIPKYRKRDAIHRTVKYGISDGACGIAVDGKKGKNDVFVGSTLGTVYRLPNISTNNTIRFANPIPIRLYHKKRKDL